MEKDIGKIKKNEIADIVIRVDDFGGKRGLTIREFVTSDRYTGFTKAGVRISAGDFPKFKEMINSVSEEDIAELPQEGQGEEQKELEEKVPEEKEKPEKKPRKGKKEEPETPKDQEALPDY